MFGDVLTLTFDWLQNWGLSVQVTEFGSEVIPGHFSSYLVRGSTFLQAFFSAQHWQDHWHSFLLAIRRALRLQWEENDGSSEKKRLASASFILRQPHVEMSERNVHAQSLDEVAVIDRITSLPLVTGIQPAETASRKPIPNPKLTEEDVSQHFQRSPAIIPVAVLMLGHFSMTIGDLTVKLSASRGLSVLKYLLLHHKENISREMLMDIFWSDAEPETARNNLNVTIHSLRKSLRTITFLPIIVYEDGAYGLEHNLEIWLDVEEFEKCVKAGRHLEAREQFSAAVAEYEAAVSLYQGDFLEQTPYEEWTILDRERLRVAYLDTIDRLSQIYFCQERYAACITVCQHILAHDRCREDTYCLLMHCYSRQGQYHLALSQYQTCVKALHEELDVEPAPETTRLYDRIRCHEHV
jgi:DNA-binding SARP family transcriptional activator